MFMNYDKRTGDNVIYEVSRSGQIEAEVVLTPEITLILIPERVAPTHAGPPIGIS